MKPEVTFLMGLTMLAALLTPTGCSSTSRPPPPVGSANIFYKKGRAGGVLVQTVKIAATVTAIDEAERQMTFQASDARKFTVRVAPAAVNFDQIQVGDWLHATVTQKVDVSLADNNASPDEDARVTKTAATKGEGRQAAGVIQRTGRIIAIDSKKCMVTLRFEDGTTETLQIRDDVDLSRRKVGEQIVFRVIEMTAIWVEKAESP